MQHTSKYKFQGRDHTSYFTHISHAAKNTDGRQLHCETNGPQTSNIRDICPP